MRRNSVSNSFASSSGCTTSPDNTSGPSGCSLNSNEVTTPKLPPPPRSAQNRSGFSVALARSSFAIRGHDVGGDEIVDREPELAGDPAEAAAEREAGDAGRRVDAERRGEPERLRLLVEVRQASRRLRRARVCAAASTRTDFISDRSISRPPSQTALPAMLWPPPRTASSRSCSRANLTALHHVGGAQAAHDERRACGRSSRSRSSGRRRIPHPAAVRPFRAASSARRSRRREIFACSHHRVCG